LGGDKLVDRPHEVFKAIRRFCLLNRRELLGVAGKDHAATRCKRAERQNGVRHIHLRRLINEDEVEELALRASVVQHQEVVGLLGCGTDDGDALGLLEPGLQGENPWEGWSRFSSVSIAEGTCGSAGRHLERTRWTSIAEVGNSVQMSW
jgi:hypothetical protein